MGTTEQNFYARSLSGELVKTIAETLQQWSISEDDEILAAYRANGLGPMRSDSEDNRADQIAAIERREPEKIVVKLSRYSVGGRQYDFDNNADDFTANARESHTIESLAAWIDENTLDQVTVRLWSNRPRCANVLVQGSSSWASITASVSVGTLFPLVDSFKANGRPEVVLEMLAAALTPLLMPSNDAPQGNCVFLGHGHGSDWKILEQRIKDAGFEPQAFEGSAVAGDVNIYVIDTAIRGSFAAVIFMTPDDLMADGTKRARQNVVHEIGFAQGALGVRNVIVVQNEDAQALSNMDGVTVVRYKTNGIFEKLDEVIAYLTKIKLAPSGK